MPTHSTTKREPKASRVRVWQAADRILRSGRRPTVEGVRETLGGGSPNSVTAYLNDWYRELGGRLEAAETPLAGFPAEAVSMMTELWRLAATDRRSNPASEADGRALDLERSALRAQVLALETLNQELQRHRSSAEKSLTEARALLTRREAALEEERAQAAVREQLLAQVRMDLEVARERQRLGSGAAHAAAPRTAVPRKKTRPKPIARKPARKAPAKKPAPRKTRKARRPTRPKRR